MDIIVTFKLYFFAVAIDFLAGVIAAAKEGKLKSRTCANGIYRSIGEIILLGGAIILALYVPLIEDIIKCTMIGFLFKEGISICENLTALGVWIPDSLKNTLEKNTEKINKGEK